MTDHHAGDQTAPDDVAMELPRRNLLLLAVNRVFREALTCESVSDVAKVCLGVAEELTGSAFGMLGEMNEQGKFDALAVSDPGWDACRMPAAEAAELLRGMELRGLLRKVIRQERSVVVNDPGNDPDGVGVPAGHPPIHCFLGVPLQESNRILGLIGLANRAGGFDRGHQADIEALAVAFVEALRRKRAEQELRAAHDELELRVQYRTAELATANAALQKEIADRQQAENALRDSEQRFRSLVETTSDWVWEVDRDAVYTYVSPRIKDLLGYEPEEVLGQRPFDLMPPDEAQRVAAAFQRVVESREPFAPLENTNVHRDGHHVVLESSGVPIVNASGELVGYRGIDRDITQRKRAENELARTLQELERSNADLQQFAGAASHDLQEPLRAIRGFAQLLQRHCAGRTDAKADEYLQFIVHGAGRMQQLINDLLAYARLGMGGKKIEPVDCNEVVAEALTNLKGALTEQDAEVTCQQLPTVAADRTRLVQLFQNLISNAIKFRGDQPPRVQISAVQSQSEWVFSVCDHGIGIALEHTERIFVVFQRLHHQSQYPGTGIGLAICKRIVEGNKGRIWCESELGHGATFRFTLPVSASST